MKPPKLLCYLSIAAVLTGTAAALGASNDQQLQQLVERLEAAEARIAELEQSSSPNASISTPSESAFTQTSWSDVEATTEIHEHIRRWELRWNQQLTTNNQLKQEISRSVQSGSDGTQSMQVEGRIHADYWGFPDSSPGVNRMETANALNPLGNPNGTPQDRIGFRRLRFGVNGDVSPNMGYKIEMEFAGGDESEFRDAYIQANNVRWLQSVVVGNHKRPYGLDHLNSSRFNVFMERPFIIEAFNQDARRLGISAQGVSSDQTWNWIYGVWNQRLI